MGLMNLSAQGMSRISIVDLETYLKQYPTPKKIFEENDGIQYLYDAEELAQEDNFGFYYARFKKFSALRALKKEGFSISDIYDDEEMNPLKVAEMQKDFDSMTLREMFLKINKKYMKLEDNFLGKTNAEYIDAGRNLMGLKEALKETPEIGFPLQGELFNTVSRGARLGKFYLLSGGSGMGKSRIMIGHCCKLAYPFTYDLKLNKWIKTGSSQKVLYISTEMDFDEVQTIILANLSGVNEERILWGVYTPDEEARVDKAISIVEEYSGNLIINKIPDPSVTHLTSAIRRHHIFDGVQYAFYDYIFSSPSLLNEYRDLKIREDVVLTMLSTALKDLAVELKMFIMSGTQLNRTWEEKRGNASAVRNQNMIRGATGIVDKIDLGAITMPVNQEELSMLARLLNELGVNPPTQVTDIYKSRRSRYKSVRIWSQTDLGTGRTTDLFMTDQNMDVIKVDKIDVQIEDDFNLIIDSLEEHEESEVCAAGGSAVEQVDSTIENSLKLEIENEEEIELAQEEPLEKKGAVAIDLADLI